MKRMVPRITDTVLRRAKHLYLKEEKEKHLYKNIHK